MSKISNTIVILGGDGYLGWSLALALANRTDSTVIIADNLIKRRWEEYLNLSPLVPLDSPERRIENYKFFLGKKNLKFKHINLNDFDSTYKLLESSMPKVVINTAQQCSAPYSMMSPQAGQETFTNNIATHSNALWSIAKINKKIKYISLGSAGVYLDVDSSFIPQQKVDLSFLFNNKKQKILNSWLPMNASDFYHQSKIHSFLFSDLCSKTWGLDITTVQQSTIFGQAIDENINPDFDCLSTKLNYDSVFGTVLNRFVCQAASNNSITVYGDGTQETGIISLNDSVNQFIQLVDSDFSKGGHKVVHNFTHKLSILEMANELSKISKCKISNIANPRCEPEHIQSKHFQKNKGFHVEECKKSLMNEVSSVFEYVKRHKDNIKSEYILPSIKWDVTENINPHTESIKLEA